MNLSKCYDYFQPETAGRVHIIGCGSVGSVVAENLARCGVTKMTLYDFDRVEAKNISNQIFMHRHIGMQKVEALKDIICEINPLAESDIMLEPEGWQGKLLSGIVILCPDNIEVRKNFVKKHMSSPYVKLVMDFRTGLEDAQHYAADWSDRKQREQLLGTMDFTHEEAAAATPVSACGITLGVAFNVRAVVAMGVANLVQFLRGKGLHRLVTIDMSKNVGDEMFMECY